MILEDKIILWIISNEINSTYFFKEIQQFTWTNYLNNKLDLKQIEKYEAITID